MPDNIPQPTFEGMREDKARELLRARGVPEDQIEQSVQQYMAQWRAQEAEKQAKKPFAPIIESGPEQEPGNRRPLPGHGKGILDMEDEEIRKKRDLKLGKGVMA